MGFWWQKVANCGVFRHVEAARRKDFMSKRTEQNQTRGTKIGAKARAECNRLSEEDRQRYTAVAMRMIYHNQADAGSAVTRRR